MTTLTTIRVLTFSPTGTSQTIADGIVQELISSLNMHIGQRTMAIEYIPLTTPNDVEGVDIPYSPNTLYICACPVYSGRIAPLAMERLKALNLQGIEDYTDNPTPVVPIVVYGNRAYDDALIELSDFFEAMDFIPIAGAAFIAEHSFSNESMPIAAHRPDQEDMNKIKNFAQGIAQQLLSATPLVSIASVLKGNRPYKTPSTSHALAPTVNHALCTECGACVEVCPSGAIKSPFEVDATTCIKCCACIKQCPEEARTLNTPVRKKLFDLCQVRQEPEIFLRSMI